jgi:phosphatidylethanolamine/phosphatidyl-N-methylethanolamine N-methyltransferase
LDAALEKRQVKRAYKLYAPAYDFVFDWIFHPGREAAIQLLAIKPGDNLLEVGIGTGLNLRLYPTHCRLTGIDLSEEMLEKAQDKVVELGLGNVTLKTMDATVMDFGQGEFDSAVATYTIPVAIS